MQRIFRLPPGEKRWNNKEVGKTPEGETVHAQVETCGKVFRLLIVVGVELVWTQRYATPHAAMEFAKDYLEELTAAFTAAPAFA